MQRDPAEFKIGIIRNTFETRKMMIGTKPGDVILFRRDDDGKTVTIESPMTDEMLEYQKSRGSGLTTIGTCIGFPRHYVEEVQV